MTKEEEMTLKRDANNRSVYDLKIYVVGGGFQYLQMFHEAGLAGARDVSEADVICFTGGHDVDPSLYDEKPLPGTMFSVERDMLESVIYGEALALKKPMVGICRGGQFLNVMNGGKMWQDVNNHGRNHPVLDMKTGEIRHNMTSTHHQMMIPGKTADILAVAEISTVKMAEAETLRRDKPEMDDIEVLWYEDERCLCFQPHPEFQHGECRNYFLELFDNYILPAC